MSADPTVPEAGTLVPGGVVAARTLAVHDVDTVFSLNGGHVWPFYDGCVREGIRLVDTRHEQTATFAAEAWAKVTRRVGVAALTAGPGVTNGISAITTAWLNGSPVFVLGGRAPQARWGQGSLQELDHVPLVAPVTRHAATCLDPAELARAFDTALVVARTPHRGPTFLDVPLDGWSPIDAARTGAAVRGRARRSRTRSRRRRARRRAGGRGPAARAPGGG